MAFVDSDDWDEPYINLTHQVGSKGPNDWDDLLVVQVMLAILYKYSPPFRDHKPIKGEVTVTGKPAKDTPVFIAHFQQFWLKTQGFGYINPVGVKKNARQSTIWNLYTRASAVWSAAGFGPEGSLISWLRAMYPTLAKRLADDTP